MITILYQSTSDLLHLPTLPDMADIVDARRRSELMAGIRGRDTQPEIAVRRVAHRMGLRFRLHRKHLPGRPDLVFPKLRLAVFVHGCFWHHHKGCKFAHIPKTRVRFWTEKFEQNTARDDRNVRALRDLGWRVFTIWECETHKDDDIRGLLTRFVNDAPAGRARSSWTPDRGLRNAGFRTPDTGSLNRWLVQTSR